jgi:hydroxyacylglutathione hydrolase
MIHIKTFVFNPFQVNTYLLYDDSKECLIIDAACYDDDERKQITDFIEKNNLKPIRLICTHGHIDHVLGIKYMMERYPGIQFEIDKDGESFLKSSLSFASVFGLEIEQVPMPTGYLKDNSVLNFGNSILRVIATPGHAAGSICLYQKEQKFVIVGDVLFQGSIGRTDLPTGNHELLLRSIQERLMVLDDDVIVYPGHGPETSIGEEKENNPYLND